MEWSELQADSTASPDEIASSLSGISDTLSRSALFDLMVLARDHQLSNAQIRMLCKRATDENIHDRLELIRHFHPSQAKKQKASSGEILTTDNIPNLSQPFPNLTKEALNKLHVLKHFCPFTLTCKRCIHGSKCQLKHVCYSFACRVEGKIKNCRFSHQVSSTWRSVFRGEECTKKYSKKWNRCFMDHDVDVRLFMGAMRKPHELGFYGVANGGAKSVRGTVFTAEEVAESVMVERMLRDPVSRDVQAIGGAIWDEDVHGSNNLETATQGSVSKNGDDDSLSSAAKFRGENPAEEGHNGSVPKQTLRRIDSTEDLIAF